MNNKQKKIEQLKKNYKLKKTQEEIYQVTPEIYAAFAIVLSERGFEPDYISDVFAETQEVWSEHVNDGTEKMMIDKCFKLTGIDVVGRNM